MIVVVCNSLISLFHELRARNATEKLKLILSKNTKVLRDSKIIDIQTENIVIDDIIIFENGDQICADCVVAEGSCEADESLLTGEPNLIEKKEGDSLLSGSFVVSGKVLARAVKVGKNTYSAKISKKLKNIKPSQSEIMLTVKKIIKIVSILIIPVGIPFFINQFRASGCVYSTAALSTSAVMIGMIPEGLALLASSVLALGAIRLARKKILAKDVYSVEALARVNTLCLDKTGTITEGSFEVFAIICQNKLETDLKEISKIYENKKKFADLSDVSLFKALKILVSSFENGNETLKSLQKSIKPKENFEKADYVVPFNSRRKFSGVFLNSHGSFLMGSAEIIFPENKKIQNLITKFSNYRILAIGHSDDKLIKDKIPSNIKFLGIVLMLDKIRKGASDALKYFYENQVDIKIISGDSVSTVTKIAKLVGVPNFYDSIDTSELNNFSDILNAAAKYTIFGRVTPEKKREIIKALKIKGKYVAMVGDGVNDILALKEADCSVAMASGSSAAREISNLILINSDFSSMPNAVFEGRRAVNNIQTTSGLFFVKTAYSSILSILMLFFSFPYPFMPIQMSLISALTVGIPSFLLALEPNTAKIENSIFSNIMRTSLPAALAICANIVLCSIARSKFSIPQNIYSSIAAATTGVLSIQLLYKVCSPMNRFRCFVFLSLALAFVICFIFYSHAFLIVSPILWGLKFIIISLILGIVSSVLYKLILRIYSNKM
jgi:cation-transporting ATPase E